MVKGNQPRSHQGIAGFFLNQQEDDFTGMKLGRHVTQEKGHGRQERREYCICRVPSDLPDGSRWKGIKAIGMAINITVKGGKERDEVRYYMLSRYLSGRRFAKAVRGHWSIKNRLHWQLDVTFREDQCRVRKAYADANLSILRRAALSMLKNEGEE